MKDLLKCSLDELRTERELAIKEGNIDRYRQCNELISTRVNALHQANFPQEIREQFS